jgi:hypothetical protein
MSKGWDYAGFEGTTAGSVGLSSSMMAPELDRRYHHGRDGVKAA